MNKKITLLLILALFSVSTSPIIGRALESKTDEGFGSVEAIVKIA